jgi:hypothetical protein
MHARLFLRLALAVGLVATAIVFRPGGAEKAEAQAVSVSVEFRTALTPHGRWQRHAQWGEVWVPARVERGWRPYTRGHWVYTDDWGWYWVSDEDWGWVTYHYGRWVFDPRVGWLWIPGNQWGPAWVSWRRGGADVGWAPLPPDDYVERIDEDPNVWIFVDARNVVAPSIVRVMLPPQRTTVLVRQTVIVNRTVYVSGARVAANAGIPPSYIAARIGRPIRVSEVRPVVVRGTVGVSNAVEVDVQQGPKQNRVRAEVKQAARAIEPAKNVPEPKQMERGNTQQQDNPDAPKVLRQAQPDQQKQDTPQQKQDAPQTQQKSGPDDAQKAKQQKRDGDARDQQKKSDDRKSDQKKDDDAQKAKQQKRDGDPRDQQKKSDDRKSDQKKDDSAQKAKQQKRDGDPRDQQPKRDAPQKQDAAPKGEPQQKAPQQKAPPEIQKQPPAQRAPQQKAPDSQRPDAPPLPEKKEQ